MLRAQPADFAWKPLSRLRICLALHNLSQGPMSFLSDYSAQIGLVVLALILVGTTIQALREKNGRHIGASLLGWITGGVLYHCRMILPAANQQYEIRELLVILLVTGYCLEVLGKFRGLADGGVESTPS